MRPEDSLAIAAYQGGVDPAVFSRVLKKYGFEMGEDVQVYRQKREEREREAKLKKRNEEVEKAQKKKRWGSRTH